jgi:hypothetical protein
MRLQTGDLSVFKWKNMDAGLSQKPDRKWYFAFLKKNLYVKSHKHYGN